VHALPSSAQVLKQFPSHFSPGSTCPSPQRGGGGGQSLSLLLMQPGAQQPSPPLQEVIGVFEHATSQVAAFPAAESVVHALPSSQVVGQFPSHFSPDSTTPLPQFGLQSLSLFAVAPGGQQWSPAAAAVISGCEQTTLH
jgi:hypothetical protein